jgi:hypothetical protein
LWGRLPVAQPLPFLRNGQHRPDRRRQHNGVCRPP